MNAPKISTHHPKLCIVLDSEMSSRGAATYTYFFSFEMFVVIATYFQYRPTWLFLTANSFDDLVVLGGRQIDPDLVLDRELLFHLELLADLGQTEVGVWGVAMARVPALQVAQQSAHLLPVAVGVLLLAARTGVRRFVLNAATAGRMRLWWLGWHGWARADGQPVTLLAVHLIRQQKHFALVAHSLEHFKFHWHFESTGQIQRLSGWPTYTRRDTHTSPSPH